MGDCPKCGFAGPGAVDFCPNPQCRTYLGWASADAPPRPVGQGPPVDAQRMAAAPPRSSAGQQATQTRPAPELPAPELPAAEPPASPPQKRGVRVTVEPAELTVDPGGQITTTVTVRNLGTRVEEFRLMPGGPAAAFTSIAPTTLSVYPDDEQRALARFAPARGPQSPAGVAPFEIVARSAIHGDVIDVAHGQVTVTPFEELGAALRPEVSRGRRPGQHQVSVTNGGNTPVDTQLTFRDQDGELTFDPPSGAATLQPGATLDFPVRINGPHRWFGSTERFPFSAVVTPTGPQPPITLNGTRRQAALLPWWIPTAAVAITAVAIALFAVLKPGPPRVPAMGLAEEAAAIQQLKDAHYEPDVIKMGDDTVAAGLAIKTDPTGGTELKHGEHVKLYISTGPCEGGTCPVEVPNVEGLPVNEALATLQDKKFTVRVNRVSIERPVDQVIASDPKPTTLRPLGSQVVLTVSSGPQRPSSPPGPQVPLAVPGPQGPLVPAGPQGPAPSSAMPSPSPSATAPAPIELPDLTTRTADDAIRVLNDLGLKPKTVIVHSNAVIDGQVLSTKPAPGSKVKPEAEVTLTVARNTARVDLIATASEAAWKTGSGKLTFPGGEGDNTGFVLIRDPGTLEDGTTAKVLETHPQWVDNGSITGVYTLAEPVVAGDHIRARVGLLKGAGGEVTFVIKANGKIIKQVTDGADGTLKDLDADLSAAKGATSIEITVLAGASAGQDWAVWQDLRLEPVVG